MTLVIVQVADSVTESSMGQFIIETPQPSGTGAPPRADRPRTSTSLSCHVLPSSALLFSALLTHSCYCGLSLSLLYFPFVRSKHVQSLRVQSLRAVCLWSACLLTHFHVIEGGGKLWHFCPLTFDSKDLYRVQFIKLIWKMNKSVFLLFMRLYRPTWEQLQMFFRCMKARCGNYMMELCLSSLIYPCNSVFSPLWLLLQTGVRFQLTVSSALICPPVRTPVPVLTTPCRELLFEGAFHILGQLEESLWAAGL